VLTVKPIITNGYGLAPIDLVEISIAPTTGPDLVSARRLLSPPELPIRLDAYTRCGHTKLLTYYISDESGSVTSRDNQRQREMDFVVDHLGACRCGNELFAHCYFDAGSHDLEPTPLTRAGMKIIRQHLASTPPATSSNAASALAKAYATAASYPDYHVAIILGTDFEWFDPDPNGLMAEFAEFSGTSHAVVLHSPVPDVFAGDGRVHVTHIRWDSPRGSVAHALLPTLARARTVTDKRDDTTQQPPRQATAAP
jgi:hypothetical protein